MAPERGEGALHIDYRDAALFKVMVNLSLPRGNAINGAEALEVRLARVVDYGNVRLRPGGGRVDVVEVARAVLHYSVAGSAGEAEQGLGDADRIVEVALGRDGVPEGAHDKGAHLLDAGLAAGAGDAEDLRVGLLPHEAARGGIAPQGVLHDDLGDVKIEGLRGEDRDGAFLDRVGGEDGAVVSCPGESHKKPGHMLRA